MRKIGYSDFRTQIMTIKELINLWEYHNMTSRESATFFISRAQRSRYVEAVLIGMPLQSVYVDDSTNEWLYISGGERVQSYVEFCKNVYPLSSLYFKDEMYGDLYFYQLSNLAKQKILNTQIQIFVLNPGLTRHERFGIYLCLKPRLDTETLKSCRKKIYPEHYYLVEDIAKDIIMNRGLHTRSSNAYLENEICHLLAIINYRVFVDCDNKISIDYATNELLEDEEIVNLVGVFRQDIILTLLETKSNRIMRYGVLVQDIYNAVQFFSPQRKIDEDTFLEAYRYTSERNHDVKDDIAIINKLIMTIQNYINS